MDPPILNLAEFLREQGIEVAIASRHRSIVGAGVRQVPLELDVDPSRRRNRLRLVTGAQFCVAVCRLALSFKPDCYVAFNWDSLLAVGVATAVRPRPVIYYQLEYTHGHREELGLLKWAVYRIAQLFEGRAAAIFAVEPHRAELVRVRLGLAQAPPVIWNTPRLHSYPFARCDIDHSGDLRVVYAGAVTPDNCIPDILASIAASRVAVTLDIYGPVAVEFRERFARLLGSAAARGVNVCYRGIVPYKQLSKVLPRYDVGLAFYSPTSLNRLYCSPAKIFEYMAAGLVPIASPTPSTLRLSEYDAVVCTAVDELPTVLAELAADRQALRRRQQRSRSLFLENYNFEKQVQPLWEVMRRVLARV